ncbi:MAG: glycoside hydrolase family 43 protein [Candidatus Methylacidiphilales bacterium]|nr:glycoside hydrolase family 43 protein [Candidatus Methylacidiphilales bacterium]
MKSGYSNPILPGFYPDPSVCRVGSDYYLVNSTFEYFPGVPIWHSRDLVHWRQIGHVLTRRSQLDLGGCPCSDGIYAPTLRHQNGVFYMATTLVKSGQYRNFYVTATDPSGPWSDPIWVDQSGIDPSLFFDDDGRAYFQTNRGLVFRMERAIYQSEIDIQTGRRLSGPDKIWGGTGGCYVEGPHIYKRNGWYYLLAAEGGTAYGHMVTIARSLNIRGPYDSCPHNPILSNRHAYEELHGTGHGDLVEAADGSWWMVHLAFRKTAGDVHTLGRETCLAPVTWENGWPVVNRNGTNSLEVDATVLPAHPFPVPPVRDDFDAPQLGLPWIRLRNPVEEHYSLTERPGFLRLHGTAESLSDPSSPTFVARRQQHFHATITAHLEFEPCHPGDRAGLSLFMTHEHHYDLFVTRENGKRVLVVEARLELIHHRAAMVVLPEAGPVHLRIVSAKELYHFGFVGTDGSFQEIATINSRYLGTEVTGGYNGVVIALYATGTGQLASGPADFDWFEYLPQ